MEREQTDSAERRHGNVESGRRRGGSRRLRLVPPAVTPLRASDIGAGLADHLRGRGRDRFRRAVETFLDAEASATYTSFRRALGACLAELRRHGSGRETVLIPAFCSSDFADAVEGVGLEVARYDVDPDTLSADLSSVEAGLRSDPLAVVAVNVLGYGSPMDELAAACDRRDAYLVEALGYALGTEYDGRRLGAFGDCAVLNFQQGKPIPVGGGMVVDRTASLSFGDAGRPAVDLNLGALAGYAAFSRPRPYYVYRRLADLLDGVGLSAPGTTHPEGKFDVEYGAPFATLSNFQGAVACRVFDRLDDHRRRRRRAARCYAEGLSDVPGVDHVAPVDGLSELQHVRYPILLATESLRDRVRAALSDVGVQATTLYDWPVVDGSSFPGAARLQRSILTLPTHPYVDDRDRRRIVEAVRAAAAEHRSSG